MTQERVLTLAKHIVTQLGGGIDYSSDSERTEFWFTVPLLASLADKR